MPGILLWISVTEDSCKGEKRDAHREFAFLLIQLISERHSALLQIVFRANRFDISLVMIWDASCMRSVKLLPHTILALLLTGMVFVPVTQLQAGASNKNGNPYGNGTFFPSSGTFSAIARGQDGFLGAFEFSTSNTNTSNANTGVATIYANGQQYSGNTFGVIDTAGSTISATYQAGYTYSLYVIKNTTNIATLTTAVNTNILTTNVTPILSAIYTNILTTNFSINSYPLYTNLLTTNAITGDINSISYIYGYTNAISTNVNSQSQQIGNTTNYSTNIMSVSQFLSNNITYTTNVTPTTTLQNYSNSVSGQFLGFLRNSYPNQVFSGSGEASVLNADGTTSVFPNSVQGSRIQ